VAEIRGAGLLVGIQLTDEKAARQACLQLLGEGVLCHPASDGVIRLTPPLTITVDEIDWAVERIRHVLS
jgi:ornithine--oxo-acid transaminase